MMRPLFRFASVLPALSARILSMSTRSPENAAGQNRANSKACTVCRKPDDIIASALLPWVACPAAWVALLLPLLLLWLHAVQL